MNIDVHPARPSDTALDATALADLDTRDFYRLVGQVNTAFNEAEAAFRSAQDNLVLLLTEQVVRHLLAVHPDAAMVFVRAAAEYHHNEAGERDPNCEGHHHRLVPFEVLDADGVVLGGFDPYSPAMYLLERLSPLLGVEDQVLDIETREWALDCTND